jgi:hypothetical protein
MSAGVIPSARRVLRAHYVRGAGRILDNREYPQWSASHLPSNAAPVAGLAARADPSALRHVMQLTARLLQHLCEAIEGAHVRDTHALDVAAARWAHAHDAYPAPLNYHAFPKAICASVNEIAVHGVPDDRPLQRGDVVNIDCSLFANAHYGDTARSVVYGGSLAATAADATLIDVARKGTLRNVSEMENWKISQILSFSRLVLRSHSCWYWCCSTRCQVACHCCRHRARCCRSWFCSCRRAWWTWNWTVIKIKNRRCRLRAHTTIIFTQRISFASNNWSFASCRRFDRSRCTHDARWRRFHHRADHRGRVRLSSVRARRQLDCRCREWRQMRNV